MHSTDDTTSTPRWSQPRLVALGNAQASQGGATAGVSETITPTYGGSFIPS